MDAPVLAGRADDREVVRRPMVACLRIPRADGSTMAFALRPAREWRTPTAPFRSRLAFAAAHVVCDPFADVNVLSESRIDWEATLAYRRHLWGLGFAVAEAMDTAQRGGGLTWPAAQQLIARSVAEARATGGIVACGAGTDHLAPAAGPTPARLGPPYQENGGWSRSVGGTA